jgi:hypothetical protein
MKFPLVIILLVVVLYQTNLSNCYWISFPSAAVGKLNQVIKSIFVSSKLKELRDDVGPTTLAQAADDGLTKKLRQFNFNKNVYVNKTTSQSTLTITVVSTTVVSTRQFCAHFVNNVFGGCRRRRELINEKIALLQPSKVVNRYFMYSHIIISCT